MLSIVTSRRSLVSSGIAALVGVASFALTSVAPAHAQELALDIATGGFTDSVNNYNLDDTVGWSFTVNSPVTVTALGVWDEGADGLLTTHQVGLWDSSGTLLASTTVTNASTAVASTSTDGDWLFNNITNVNLGTGSYTVGALYTSDSNDPIRFSTAETTDSRIGYSTPEGSYVSAGSGLTDPTTPNIYPSPSVFGPNLMIVPTSGAAAPEPGSAVLSVLAALPMSGLFLRKRSRK